MCHSASLGSALTPVGEEGVARHPPSDPVPAVLVAIGPGQGPCGCAGEPGTRKRMTHKKKNSTASLLPAFCVVRGCRKLPKNFSFFFGDAHSKKMGQPKTSKTVWVCAANSQPRPPQKCVAPLAHGGGPTSAVAAALRVDAPLVVLARGGLRRALPQRLVHHRPLLDLRRVREGRAGARRCAWRGRGSPARVGQPSGGPSRRAGAVRGNAGDPFVPDGVGGCGDPDSAGTHRGRPGASQAWGRAPSCRTPPTVWRAVWWAAGLSWQRSRLGSHRSSTSPPPAMP